MSSSSLLTLAGTIFLLIPLGHTKMYFDVLHPGLRALGAAPAAYASKVSWNQANGYFVASGMSSSSDFLGAECGCSVLFCVGVLDREGSGRGERVNENENKNEKG